MASPVSFADTIVNASPFIPIILDLPSHNYYNWRHLFDVHLGRYNLHHHVAANSVPRLDDPRWVKDDLTIMMGICPRGNNKVVLFNIPFVHN
jgi:hypothetical protein